MSKIRKNNCNFDFKNCENLKFSFWFVIFTLAIILSKILKKTKEFAFTTYIGV